MAELQRKKQKSVGTVCKDAIMTGISYINFMDALNGWQLVVVLSQRLQK